MRWARNKRQWLICFAVAAVSVPIAEAVGSAGYRPPVEYQAGRGSLGVKFANVVGDHHKDLIVTSRKANLVTFFTGRRGGLFGQAQPLTCRFHPDGIAVGDFNRDGRKDV